MGSASTVSLPNMDNGPPTEGRINFQFNQINGPGNFGALQEISPSGPPPVLQFAARFTF